MRKNITPGAPHSPIDAIRIPSRHKLTAHPHTRRTRETPPLRRKALHPGGLPPNHSPHPSILLVPQIPRRPARGARARGRKRGEHVERPAAAHRRPGGEVEVELAGLPRERGGEVECEEGGDVAAATVLEDFALGGAGGDGAGPDAVLGGCGGEEEGVACWGGGGALGGGGGGREADDGQGGGGGGEEMHFECGGRRGKSRIDGEGDWRCDDDSRCEM